jgi:hypothetical protein
VYWRKLGNCVINSSSQEITKRKVLCWHPGKNGTPKENGGWGLKILFLFSKALATKNVWRLVQGKGLWV